MQTVVVSSAGHKTAGKAVDNKNVAVLNDIVHLVFHNAVSLDSNINVVVDACVFGIGEILDVKVLLGLLDTVLGKNGCSRLLVYDIVLFVNVKILL